MGAGSVRGTSQALAFEKESKFKKWKKKEIYQLLMPKIKIVFKRCCSCVLHKKSSETYG
jgi:hypothetical protein